MHTPTRLTLRLLPRLTVRPVNVRTLHSTIAKPAYVAPIVGTGPPPEAPADPERALLNAARVERRRKQAEMLKSVKQIRRVQDGKSSGGGLKSRFWKEVAVHEVDGRCYAEAGIPQRLAIKVHEK